MGVEFGYRGQQLGLPETGPGSIARPGRRFAALFLDWALCLLIAYGLLSGGKAQSASNWALVVFAVLSVLTVGTVGFTPGKRLLGLRVVAEGGGRISLPRVVLRTVLLVVVIPAVVWDRDGRGCTIASRAPCRSASEPGPQAESDGRRAGVAEPVPYADPAGPGRYPRRTPGDT